jgi:hypothetical protein
MSVSTNNVSISGVSSVLGKTIYKLSELCTDGSINRWSEHKPYSSTGPGSSYDGGTGNGKTNGLYRETGGGKLTFYNKPTGGTSSPYRLGDFREYNHTAGAPVQVHFTDVRLKGSDSSMSAPYTLIGGFEYTLTMSIVAGEIPSLEICTQTHPTKVTGSSGGEYGGLFLYDSGASPIDPLPVEIDSSSVFSIGNNQIADFTCVQTSGYPFDIYFAAHSWEAEPPAHDLYTATGWTIEDTSCYTALFRAAPLDIGITSTNVLGISDPLSVMCSGILTNDTGDDVVIDVKISVSINGNTTRVYTQTDYTLVSAGATWAYDLATSYHADFVDGSNTVIGTMFLQKGAAIYVTEGINETFNLDLT